jgi:hypothetical protein
MPPTGVNKGFVASTCAAFVGLASEQENTNQILYFQDRTEGTYFNKISWNSNLTKASPKVAYLFFAVKNGLANLLPVRCSKDYISIQRIFAVNAPSTYS